MLGLQDPQEKVARELFERYDLDSSGTMNNGNELRQFVVNMLYTTRAPRELSDRVNAQMEDLLRNRDEHLSWDFNEVWGWYNRAKQQCP